MKADDSSCSTPTGPARWGDPTVIWKWVNHRDNWLGLDGAGQVTDDFTFDTRPLAVPPRIDEFDVDGYAVMRAISQERAAVLAQCVLAVKRLGLPPVFAYVFDELWEPLGPIISHLAGRIGPCRALDDGWAWVVTPRLERGWLPHRGVYEYCRDSEGNVLLVNVWLALVDVDAGSSTIAIVPRSADQHYPHDLRSEPELSAGRILTAEAGEMFYWDANAFHWGTEGSTATHPRVSASYTIAAESFHRTSHRVDSGTLTFDRRLDLVAAWINTYTAKDPTMSEGVQRWSQWRAAAAAARR